MFEDYVYVEGIPDFVYSLNKFKEFWNNFRWFRTNW
jgi:hypothetical protein